MAGVTQTPDPAVNSEWITWAGFPWIDPQTYTTFSGTNITARDLRIIQEVLMAIQRGQGSQLLLQMKAKGINPGVLYGLPSKDLGLLYSGLSDELRLMMLGENRIINPFGQIDQRREGASTTVAAAANAFVSDRWKVFNETSAGVVTITANDSTVPSQNDFALNGETYYKIPCSMKLAFTTVDTSLGASEFVIARQIIEGYNAADIIGDGFNTGFNVSFWIRSPKAGPHGVRVTNSAQDRTYLAGVNIKSANVWQYVRVYVKSAPPSGGTWNLTNGAGLYLDVCFVGPATSGTYRGLDGVWHSASVYYTDGQVNCADVNTNVAYITAVKVSPGLIVTPCQRIPQPLQLYQCKRYCEAINAETTADGFATVHAYSTTGSYIHMHWEVEKRSGPSSITYSNVSHFKIRQVNSVYTIGAFNASAARTKFSANDYTSGDSAYASGLVGRLESVNVDAQVLIDSEL